MSSEKKNNIKNLSITELRKLVKKKNEDVKKLEEKKERELLILAYKKLEKKKEKLIQKDKESKRKLKSKFKHKLKSNTKSKTKIKHFDDYFQECIKSKTIPKDTPPYSKKALLRAMKECDHGIKQKKSSFKSKTKKYVIDGETILTPETFFAKKEYLLKDFMKKHRRFKLRLTLVCLMYRKKKINGGKDIIEVRTKMKFNSNIHIIYEKTDVGELLNRMIEEIDEKISHIIEDESNWQIEKIISLEIHTAEYKPMKGNSYIPLPDFIMRKKAILNMENNDQKCFLWSILRYLHPVQKNGIRIYDLRKYENDLNFKGIEFSVKIKDIQKFENQNPDLPGIKVLSLDDNNKIYPLRLNEKDCVKSIDLFLFSKDNKQHYSLIKNFTRLVRSQITKDKRKIFICKKCLSHYTTKDLFEKHKFYCGQNETVVVKMPTKNILKFKNYFKKLPIPFVIYADFECFTKPMNSCQPDPNSSYTQGYQKHEPSGYCLFLKGLD